MAACACLRIRASASLPSPTCWTTSPRRSSTSRLAEKAFHQARQQRGPFGHRRYHDVLPLAVGVVAHRSEAVERGDAEAGGEVAVRAAADRPPLERPEAEVVSHVPGPLEQLTGRVLLERRTVGLAPHVDGGSGHDWP